jgi:transcription antitermination factor NusG
VLNSKVQTAGAVEVEALEGTPWYIVKSAASKERLAKFHLKREGYEVYLPMRASLSHRKGGAQPTPLFPRFLFVRQGAASGFHEMFSTIGVSSVLTFGRNPATLADRWVSRLKAREQEGLIVLAEEPPAQPCPFQPGEKVRVKAGGRLAVDIDGVFVERVDEKRVAILLSLLSRDSRVVIALDRVSPSSADA